MQNLKETIIQVTEANLKAWSKMDESKLREKLGTLSNNELVATKQIASQIASTKRSLLSFMGYRDGYGLIISLVDDILKIREENISMKVIAPTEGTEYKKPKKKKEPKKNKKPVEIADEMLPSIYSKAVNTCKIYNYNDEQVIDCLNGALIDIGVAEKLDDKSVMNQANPLFMKALEALDAALRKISISQEAWENLLLEFNDHSLRPPNTYLWLERGPEPQCKWPVGVLNIRITDVHETDHNITLSSSSKTFTLKINLQDKKYENFQKLLEEIKKSEASGLSLVHKYCPEIKIISEFLQTVEAESTDEENKAWIQQFIFALTNEDQKEECKRYEEYRNLLPKTFVKDIDTEKFLALKIKASELKQELLKIFNYEASALSTELRLLQEEFYSANENTIIRLEELIAKIKIFLTNYEASLTKENLEMGIRTLEENNTTTTGLIEYYIKLHSLKEYKLVPYTPIHEIHDRTAYLEALKKREITCKENLDNLRRALENSCKDRLEETLNILNNYLRNLENTKYPEYIKDGNPEKPALEEVFSSLNTLQEEIKSALPQRPTKNDIEYLSNYILALSDIHNKFHERIRDKKAKIQELINTFKTRKLNELQIKTTALKTQLEPINNFVLTNNTITKIIEKYPEFEELLKELNSFVKNVENKKINIENAYQFSIPEDKFQQIENEFKKIKNKANFLERLLNIKNNLSQLAITTRIPERILNGFMTEINVFFTKAENEFIRNIHVDNVEEIIVGNMIANLQTLIENTASDYTDNEIHAVFQFINAIISGLISLVASIKSLFFSQPVQPNAVTKTANKINNNNFFGCAYLQRLTKMTEETAMKLQGLAIAAASA